MAITINGTANTVAGLTAGGLPDNTVDGGNLAMGSDAAGDILYYNGTDYIRLAKGTDGQVLKLASGVPTWAYQGLAMVDQWRVTANGSVSADTDSVFASNWEQVDGTEFGTVGSAMTESSGIFTFPLTGVYKVEFVIFANDTESTSGLQTKIQMTVNNSSYNTIAIASDAIPDIGTYNYITTYTSALVDVTDVSQCKVKFSTYSGGTFDYNGDSSKNETHANFIRLGDT